MSGYTNSPDEPDIYTWLRQKIAEDKQFISDHHGYCQEYPQNARVEVVGELLDQHANWSDRAEAWDYREDYYNERALYLGSLLELIAENWEDFTE